MAYQKPTGQSVRINNDLWAELQIAGRDYVPRKQAGEIVELAAQEWLDRRADVKAKTEEATPRPMVKKPPPRGQGER